MIMTNTNTEKRIAKYARGIAKVVIGLRAEGTEWAKAEAERLAAIATERCQEMRVAARG